MILQSHFTFILIFAAGAGDAVLRPPGTGCRAGLRRPALTARPPARAAMLGVPGVVLAAALTARAEDLVLMLVLMLVLGVGRRNARATAAGSAGSSTSHTP